MECRIRNMLINYEIIGKGKPIIMIHGFMLDHRVMTGCMEPVFNGLNQYKRIYFDLPGMGKSENPAWVANADCMLDIVIDFINEIIPGENFLLAGESYGGYLSRGVVYKMKDKVDGLLLLCPVIIADNKKRNVPDQEVLYQDQSMAGKVAQEDAEDFYSNAVVLSETVYERYRKEIRSGIKIADNTFLTKLKDEGYEYTFDAKLKSIKFNKPTLFLLGRQDSCVGYKDAWGILEDYPRATFAVLDRAGHNLQLESEELFHSLVKEWLYRIEELK